MTHVQFILLSAIVMLSILFSRILIAFGIITLLFIGYGVAWIVLTPFVWIEHITKWRKS